MTTTTESNFRDDPFCNYSAGEVARRLGVSVRYVYKLLNIGALRGRRVGRGWRVTPEAVKMYLSHCGKAA